MDLITKDVEKDVTDLFGEIPERNRKRAYRILLEWLIEDGNKLKSNRINIFNKIPKYFGFYSKKDSKGEFCFNVLIFAEYFHVNSHGREKMYRLKIHHDELKNERRTQSLE